MNRDAGVRSRREPFHATTGCREVRKRIRKFASGSGKTTARIVLVWVALLVALLPLAQAESQAPRPTPPGPKVGTRRASLKVHWIRSAKQSNPDADISTTGEQRLDATILLEIPDIDYFGKPQWWVFGYMAGRVIAPDKQAVPKGPPIKLPQTKLLSFSGQVSTDYKTALTVKVTPSCAGETHALTERGESALQTGGLFAGFMLQLIGGVATVSVTSDQFTATRQETNSCPAVAAQPPQTVNMYIRTASFPERGENVPPTGPNQSWKTRSTVDPGWTAQTTRTATGYSGTARRHYQDNGQTYGVGPGADVTEEMLVTLDLWVRSP